MKENLYKVKGGFMVTKAPMEDIKKAIKESEEDRKYFGNGIVGVKAVLEECVGWDAKIISNRWVTQEIKETAIEVS